MLSLAMHLEIFVYFVGRSLGENLIYTIQRENSLTDRAHPRNWPSGLVVENRSSEKWLLGRSRRSARILLISSFLSMGRHSFRGHDKPRPESDLLLTKVSALISLSSSYITTLKNGIFVCVFSSRSNDSVRGVVAQLESTGQRLPICWQSDDSPAAGSAYIEEVGIIRDELRGLTADVRVFQRHNSGTIGVYKTCTVGKVAQKSKWK
jgi:hypothetical protein